ncbi:Excalibur domain protein [Ferrimonas balearica DSM 9799]|uniref:Excalibur domain protein n=1 Tax=Ferrimonas balearica (strain DSM 9799 / CCM 4581 / KCTC 23876 / PAT) TaxID=550540 RepID=E1SUG2_FERBD|nr:excalibur calcium-binding domain-containing protein [Ferrimonas balearica]ADN77269.1 Excalibur domain protein [Ferrimonas balearica DSM 9799]
MNKFTVLLGLGALLFYYQTQTETSDNMVDAEPPAHQVAEIEYEFEPVAPRFRCDGRRYCSEMTSRAEAVFFIQNCPDTRMDGDNDGIPCERDSRW